jgi:hypothetical protein
MGILSICDVPGLEDEKEGVFLTDVDRQGLEFTRPTWTGALRALFFILHAGALDGTNRRSPRATATKPHLAASILRGQKMTCSKNRGLILSGDWGELCGEDAQDARQIGALTPKLRGVFLCPKHNIQPQISHTRARLNSFDAPRTPYIVAYSI